MDNIYKSLQQQSESAIEKSLKGKTNLKQLYREFFNDFRDSLVDFVRASIQETVIAEFPVGTTPVKIYNGEDSGRYLTLKNQGRIECYINSGQNGGFRLDPGNREKFWANTIINIVTVSGNTTVGIIKS